MNSVKVLISLAANQKWPLLQFDLKNVFLHEDLAKEVYMASPPGFHVSNAECKVCRLRKALYGLK